MGMLIFESGLKIFKYIQSEAFEIPQSDTLITLPAELTFTLFYKKYVLIFYTISWENQNNLVAFGLNVNLFKILD